MDNNNCETDAYSKIYFTQLFTTLGQISAVIFSSSIAIPIASYYSKAVKQYWFGKQD